MTSPDLDQAKVIVISPRGKNGSIYGHNFYDVYSKDENGVVKMSRFYSKSSYGQFYGAASEVDPFNGLPEESSDADFITSPLITYKSLAEIHRVFNRSEATMRYGDLCHLLETCDPAISAYIEALAQNPWLADEEYLKRYNATINLADACLGIGYSNQTRQRGIIEAVGKPCLRERVLAYLGGQTVCTTGGGCGLSAGYQISANSYGFQSVAEFGVVHFSYGKDQYGTLEIHCEECGATYQRTPGVLEAKCRICGGIRGIVC